MTDGPRRVVVEADGGSRGNPGPSAYGALLKDADTGEVLAEDGSTIGLATNNVAEYSGLIAGLRLAAEFAPDADIEVRMDSKLVVEQMSGRWKIKHPGMRPLAMEANSLAPFGTTYTWVPRAQNAYADRLANEALDGTRSGVSVPGQLPGEEPFETVAARPEEPRNEASRRAQPLQDPAPDSLIEEIEDPDTDLGEARPRGWSPASGPPTTVVLVRHGVTAHTVEKRFSGGLASANPGLSEEGRDQVRATAEWLRPLGGRIDAVISSPVRRTLESAGIVAEALGKQVAEEPGFAEMEFGRWDGMTFTEVAEQHADELDGWLGSMDVAPRDGESFRQVEERVLAGLQRLLDEHAGRTVVVVSHVTPIKTLVAHTVGAPLDAVFRMELSPASVTVVSFFTGGRDGTEPRASLRLYNARPGEEILPSEGL